MRPRLVFDDKTLTRFLRKNDIAFTTNKEGLIDLTRDIKGDLPEIEIPKEYTHVHLKKLRSCGELNAYSVDNFKAEALEHVYGHLHAPSAHKFKANALREVHGHLNTQWAERFSAENLREIKGNLCANRAEGVVRFNKLRRVNKNFDTHGAIRVEAKVLKHIGGHLDARFADSAQFYALESVKSYVDLGNARQVTVNNLETIGNHFNLKRATMLQAKSLTFIGGDCNARHVKEFNMTSLEVVERSLNIRNAQQIHANKLKQVGQITVNNSLAETTAGALLFSPKIGTRVSVFNQNTGMVQLGERASTTVENARDILQKKTPNKKHRQEYQTFLTERPKYQAFLDQCYGPALAI